MDKPEKLYRGSPIKLDMLEPQPVLENEKDRFPAGTESVVFATQHKQEALVYAITSGRDLGAYHWAPYWKDESKGVIGWRLTLQCHEDDLPKNEITYLYEIDPERFERNSVGEWYSTSPVKPEHVHETTIGEALAEFDEVHFMVNTEGRIQGEGTQSLK